MPNTLVKLILNNKMVDKNYFNKVRPVYVGIPVKPFRINIEKHHNSKNFFEETIKYFYDKFKDKKKVADYLCLNDELVEVVLNNEQNNIIGKFIDLDSEVEEDELIIFYNLYNDEFIENYLYLKEYKKRIMDVDATINSYDNSGIVHYQKTIGDSNGIDIYLLPNKSTNNDYYKKIDTNLMLSCANCRQAFDRDQYKKPVYLGEEEISYIVTKLELNQQVRDIGIVYNAINPFLKQVDDYSIYFTNIINKYIESNTNKKFNEVLIKYKNKILELNKKRLTKKVVKESAEDIKLNESIKRFFNNANVKKDRFLDDIELLDNFRNMVKFIKQIKQYDSNDDLVDQEVKGFYDSANNVLEIFFYNIFRKYKMKLTDVIVDKNNKEAHTLLNFKTYGEAKGLLVNYSNALGLAEYDEEIRKTVDYDTIEKIIRSGKNTKITPNLYASYMLCVIANYYTDCNFIKIFDEEKEERIEYIKKIQFVRKKASHEFYKVEGTHGSDITKIYESIIKMIASYYNIDIENKDMYFKNEITTNDAVDIEKLTALFDVPDIETNLKRYLSNIVSSLYIFNGTFYKDVTMLFSDFADMIYHYCSRFIQNINSGKYYNNKISNDIDKEISRLNNLLKDVNFKHLKDKLTVKIEEGKKILTNSDGIIADSTKISFSFILLSYIDESKFKELFSQLKQSFVDDFIYIINIREHRNDAKFKEDNINIYIEYINRLIEYCKIFSISLEERERI